MIPEQHIDRLLAAWNKSNTPGCGIAVIHRGERVFAKTYGCAILESASPWRCDTPAHVGSLTKQFTAVLLVRLAEQGAIDLDESIRVHLPELPGYAEKVTLRHCLSNISGLRYDEGLAWFAGRDWQTPTSLDWMFDLLCRQSVAQDDPGQVYSYNDTGFRLAVRAAERATRQTASNLFETVLFKPLGMRATYLETRGAYTTERKASTYCLHGNRYFRHLPYMELGGDGGVVSTLEDLEAWGRYLLTQEAATLAQTPLLANGLASTYGMGTFVGWHRGHRWFGHSGGGVGYSVALAIPDAELVVVMLGNADSLRPRRLALHIADAWLEGGAPSAMHAYLNEDGALLGSFANLDTGVVIQVSRIEDVLQLERYGLRTWLRYIKGQWESQEGAWSALVRTDDPAAEHRLDLDTRGQREIYHRVTWSAVDVAAAKRLVGRYACTDIAASMEIRWVQGILTLLVADGPDGAWRLPLEQAHGHDVFRAGSLSFRALGSKLLMHGRNVTSLRYQRSTRAL